MSAVFAQFVSGLSVLVAIIKVLLNCVHQEMGKNDSVVQMK